jgi:hypothetical protein
MRISDQLECGGSVLALTKVRWVPEWADDYEVVIHQIYPKAPMSLFDEEVFSFSIMYEENVSITVLACPQSLSGSPWNRYDSNPRFFRELRKEIIQES